MNALKRFFCRLFGYCEASYSEEYDPAAQRIISIGNRVDILERHQWRPRDLFDIP